LGCYPPAPEGVARLHPFWGYSFTANIEMAFDEGVVIAMADISYREKVPDPNGIRMHSDGSSGSRGDPACESHPDRDANR
jgi:hypothetical protein